jgi:hypothetical protein
MPPVSAWFRHRAFGAVNAPDTPTSGLPFSVDTSSDGIAYRVLSKTLTVSGGYIDSSYPDFRDYRDQRNRSRALLRSRTGAELARMRRGTRLAEFVSGNFFDVLGVRTAGRFFLPGTERRTEQESHRGAGRKF